MSVVRSGLTLSGAPSFPLKKGGVGAVEWVKIGQGVKPGIGDYLPGEEVVEDISKMRMTPKGTDALSPAL
jgi:hypothetical protein